MSSWLAALRVAPPGSLPMIQAQPSRRSVARTVLDVDALLRETEAHNLHPAVGRAGAESTFPVPRSRTRACTADASPGWQRDSRMVTKSTEGSDASRSRMDSRLTVLPDLAETVAENDADLCHFSSCP